MSNTADTINPQPAGPVELYTINRVHISTCDGGALAALAPNASAQASGPLLVAAYNAFDKAGRDLSIDAATLAERIDLAALIRCALEATSPTVAGCSPQAMNRALGLRYLAGERALSPIAELVRHVQAAD